MLAEMVAGAPPMALQISEPGVSRAASWRSALSRVAASPATWCALATALLFMLPDSGPSALANWLGDTDDTVRLVTVRELLGGAPWFDTTLPRIGAPEPLVSHWSRLIDAPLAVLMLLFRPLLGVQGAEIATRMVWPALLFFVLQLMISREAFRRAGPWAAAFAVALPLLWVMPLVQFKPGRIDHHNAQILCAVAGLMFLVRSLEEERIGWIAGALIGLGLAVGYEAIGLVVPALGLAAIVVLWEGRGVGGVARAATAAAGVLLAALVMTVPPSRWFVIHCDALSLNLPLLAGCCALGLWAVRRVPDHLGAGGRLGVAGLCAALGAVLYGFMEPACLMGPFGQVNPALKPIWLDRVMESKSILSFGDNQYAPMLAFVAFVLAGIVAQFAIWRARPTTSNALATAIVVLAAMVGCWQIKLMLYASWLAVLPIAVFAARLQRVGSFTGPIVGVCAVMLLNQSTLAAVFEAGEVAVRALVRATPEDTSEADVGKECARTSNVARLAELPPGLVAANIDLGPHIVAMTPHRVVAAPYHRLDKGILAGHAILLGPPEEAERVARSLGVTYIALCGAAGAAGATPTPGGKYPNSLRAKLMRGEPVGFLQEIAPAPGKPIRVWRVLSAG
jgi:hypothetical protein